MNLKNLTKPIRIFNIELHISALVLFAIAFYMNFAHRLLLAYGIAALHEYTHIYVAKRLGTRVSVVELLPFGVTMRLGEEGIKNPSHEIIIALAGPLVNFASAYIIYGFYRGGYRDFVLWSSLVMGAFNLLPVLPLDGGRIMRAILVKRYGHIKGTSAAIGLTKFLSVFVIASGAYLLYKTGFNFSVLLIGGFLAANITEERKNAENIIIKDILYSRQKLVSGNALREGRLAMGEWEYAKRVLPRLSYDRYYLIDILDKDARVLKTVTETALIEGIALYGTNVKIKKFV